MASFVNALRTEGTRKFTENGAPALNTTGAACLDLFGSIGSLRTREESDICRLFGEAYKEDPLIATKIAFYARDIRDGLGERKTFRSIIRYLAIYHPNAIIPNISLIGIYGRYDDLYVLVGTPCESAMWTEMAIQFHNDRHNMEDGKPISLLAKWIKTPDASSKRTRELGILTAKNLGYSVYRFKRILRAMRKYLKVVEGYMSTNQWDKIEYPEVPSRAMMIYRNAFIKHDETRFSEFTIKAVSGEVKVNSSTLYPYDIVEKMSSVCWGNIEVKEDPLLEAQWRQLPNYVEPGTNALVIADTSVSMYGRPMATSIGLAFYFAERNVGAYQNLFIPFSSSACVHRVTGETLAQKITSLRQSNNFGYCGSTNMEKAFQEVLDIAVRNNVPKSEMVKSLIIISDMEIDAACTTVDDSGDYWSRRNNDIHWSFYDNMRARYERAGYDMPNVIFWDVDSRHDTFHADANKKGVQLVSGQSTTVFKQVMDSIGLTPIEMMMKVINSERYAPISIA